MQVKPGLLVSHKHITDNTKQGTENNDQPHTNHANRINTYMRRQKILRLDKHLDMRRTQVIATSTDNTDERCHSTCTNKIMETPIVALKQNTNTTKSYAPSPSHYIYTKTDLLHIYTALTDKAFSGLGSIHVLVTHHTNRQISVAAH